MRKQYEAQFAKFKFLTQRRQGAESPRKLNSLRFAPLPPCIFALNFPAGFRIMIARKTMPVVLTIAGSDSGGGAGIQADLKTFAALGVHGTSAIACLTAQNPKHVLAVEPSSPKMLRQQIEAVFEELNPAAVKTGMLFSAKNISVVANFFQNPHSTLRVPQLVVDPVMVSTSGARLLQPAAEKILRERLLPLATLVTPNLDEAEILAEQKISSPEDLRSAARKIHVRYGCAVLAKGGHLKDSSMAIDVFFDGETELLLSAPFVKGVATHGTGCTYSAAIGAALALGHDLPHAVAIGKNFITAAIAGSYRIGKHFALGQISPSARKPSA
jgi:hydroxymethylpyrimidine/phosphomethylpyrimidine kinase